MEIKILIATHREYEMPKDHVYLPVRVNNAASDNDFGYQGDDQGDNISYKNPNFCELTALYWGWKNLQCDYIGLAHYRRHFSCKQNLFKEFFRWLFRCDANDMQFVLTDAEVERLCEKYSIVLPSKRRYFIETIWSHYAHTHDISHLVKTREVIGKLCPDYLPSFDKVVHRTWSHMFNMFIMRKSLADDYCRWLFPILFELEQLIDTSGMSSFDARLYGRISEFLLDVWIDTNRLQYKEIGFVQIGKENWPKKISGFLMAKFFGKKYSQSK